MQTQNNTGNALFLILIAVALFGALSYAITQSGRGGGSITKEQALIDSAVSNNQQAAIQAALMRMSMAGCADTEISFWNDSNGDGSETNADTYYNSNSPTNKSCHVYHTDGAGVTHLGVSQTYGQPQTGNSISEYYSGSLNYSNTESTAPDLSLYVRYVNDDFCRQVNIDNGLGSTLSVGGGSCVPGRFGGTYSLAGCSDNQVGPNHEFCTQQFGVNTYYKLLISR